MDTIEQILNITYVENNTNFWMIRTKRGFFFDEFISNSYIGIGWNLITKSMISQAPTQSQSNELKDCIKETYNESKPGTALNKCIRFCYELKTGDIAVIVDNDRIAFASIGEYYEEGLPRFSVELEKEVHSRIEKAKPNTDSFDCPYIKRRRITVLKVIDRNGTVSPYLQNAIARNWHSLSDLTEYGELILSGCFDAFVFKDKLTVTFRVMRKGHINVLDLANFVLLAARLLSNNDPESVQVKTNLHSPGDIILQIWNFAHENVFSLLLCYVVVFGGKVGDYEFNSLVSVVKNLINRKHDDEKRELELRKLAADVDAAEQGALGKKLENIEKMRGLHLNNIDECARELATASENLEITPSNNTIIDITRILEQQRESNS